MAQLASSKIYGDAIVTNDLQVFGALNVNDGISIGGTSFVNSTRNITAGTISATGAITVTSGGLNITGASTFSGNLTVGNAATIESSTGNLTIQSKNGGSTLNLNGTNLTVAANGRLTTSYSSAGFISLPAAAADKTVTNLSADRLRGYTPEDFFSASFKSMGVGIVSGFETNFVNNLLTVTTGHYFTKDHGFLHHSEGYSKSLGEEFLEKRSADPCRWHAIVLTTTAGDFHNNNTTSVGQILIYQEPDTGIPGQDVRPQKPHGNLTNPIVIAKIRYINSVEGLSRAKIFPMRDFIKSSISEDSIQGQRVHVTYWSDQPPHNTNLSAEALQALGNNGGIISLDTMGSYNPQPLISLMNDGSMDMKGALTIKGNISTEGTISTNGGNGIDVSGLSGRWEKAFDTGHIHIQDIGLVAPTRVNRTSATVYQVEGDNLLAITAIYKNGIRLKERRATPTPADPNDYRLTPITGTTGIEITFVDGIDATNDNLIIDVIDKVVV